MKITKNILYFMAVVSGFCSLTHATTWQTVYSTDFSTNPNWSTNEPTRYYWNSSSQDYTIKQIDAQLDGYYGVHDVDSNPDSFRITYDICPLSFPLSGSTVQFGIWGANHESYNEGYGDFVRLAFVNDAAGGLHLQFDTVNGSEHPATNDWNHFSLDTWYHAQIEYDSLTQCLSAVVNVRDTGQSFASMTLSDIGPFSSDMTLFGSSCFSNQWRQGYPGAEGIATIDNVAFQVPIPEPATILLLGIGGLLLRKKK